MSTKKHATFKVKHAIDRDKDGKATITSTVKNPPKLKEAVDAQQVSEETGHKLPPLPKAGNPRGGAKKETVKPKPNGETSELDHKILQALDALGGKDIASIDLAKKVGTTKTHPDAPRAPIRHAMERFEKLGYVKSEKKGAKYLFSINDKGKTALMHPASKDVKDSTKASKKDDPAPEAKPASNPSTTSERPANTDIECPKCHTFNVYHAEFCKQCGAPMKAEAVADGDGACCASPISPLVRSDSSSLPYCFVNSQPFFAPYLAASLTLTLKHDGHVPPSRIR